MHGQSLLSSANSLFTRNNSPFGVVGNLTCKVLILLRYSAPRDRRFPAHAPNFPENWLLSRKSAPERGSRETAHCTSLPCPPCPFLSFSQNSVVISAACREETPNAGQIAGAFVPMNRISPA